MYRQRVRKKQNKNSKKNERNGEEKKQIDWRQIRKRELYDSPALSHQIAVRHISLRRLICTTPPHRNHMDSTELN